MKLFVVLCLVGVAAAEVSLHAVLQAKWNNFKATHGKTYEPHEEQQSLNAFLEKSIEIEEHNERFHKGQENYKLGHNQFSDMPHEKFVNTVLMTPRIPPAPTANETLFVSQPHVSIPASVDWTSYTPHVKNQGQCGSCYTFGAIGSLEGLLAMRRKGVVTRLSEQHLLDCTRKHGNQGCGGGWDHDCFQFIKENGGVFTEAGYPYYGQEYACPAANKCTKTARIDGYVKVNNEVAFTNALYQVGVLSAALDASVRSFGSYSGGIYDDANCGRSGYTSHIVTVVGYGEANGIPYYKIKNSWGTGWGEGGFMRMSRKVCLTAQYGVYPVVPQQ